MLKVAFLSRASWPLFYIFKYLFPCSCSALASDETSSPALASLSWTHLFLPRLWKPAPAWVRSALDNPHLPPRPWWGIRRWMDGWIFNFLLPPLHPLTSCTDTYMLWELLCAESWAVLEMSLIKKKAVAQGERPLWRVPSCLSSYSDTCSPSRSAKPFTFRNILNKIKKNASGVRYYTCARELTVPINWS